MHLAVVDPGVGGERRALALRSREDDRVLVGPDNGLLWLGGAGARRRQSRPSTSADSAERIEPMSHTFHGRDVFAPVAGALRAGIPLRRARGARSSPAQVLALDLPQPRWDGRTLIAHVLSIDAFGNVALDVSPARRQAGGPSSKSRCGGRSPSVARTFGAVAPGELLAYVDARGALGARRQRRLRGGATRLARR